MCVKPSNVKVEHGVGYRIVWSRGKVWSGYRPSGSRSYLNPEGHIKQQRCRVWGEKRRHQGLSIEVLQC